MMSPKRDPRTGWQPKYCRHKSGHAYVRIAGRQIYLGQYGSKESLKEYERVIREWRENQFDLPEKVHKDSLICELCAAYLGHIQKRYLRNGRPTAAYWKHRMALMKLDEMYGEEFVNNFTTSKLHRIREQFTKEKQRTRVYVNALVDIVRQIFRWGVEYDMVNVNVYHALQAVSRLSRSHATDATKELDKVLPVSREHLDKTIQHLSPPLNDLLRVHHLLGCRANEAFGMRVGDLFEVDGHWQYRPRTFKQDQNEKVDLYYWVGPQAKKIIEQNSQGKDADDYVFLWNDNPIGIRLYRRHIQRACKQAGVPDWLPKQVRHLRATEIREAENAAGRHGGEGAQAVLRHHHMAVTERYAEKDKIAQRIQTEMG